MTIAARLMARLRRPPMLVILALNLVPAVCVVLFGWSAGVLLLLYWTENVIVGAFNIARMGLSGLAWGGVGMAMALFCIPFFVFHYGLFCFVHGAFVLVMGFGPGVLAVDTLTPTGLFAFVSRMAQEEPGFARSLAAILAAQSVSFLFDLPLLGGPKPSSPMIQMFAPYPRIVVMHMAIFAGAIPTIMLGSPAWAVVALALVKTAFELRGGTEGYVDETSRRRADTSVRAIQRLLRRRKLRKTAP